MIKLNYLEVKNILEKYPNSKITKYRKNNYHKFEWAIEIPADTEDPLDSVTVYPIRKIVAKKLLALDK
jgi:hypothetical protein